MKCECDNIGAPNPATQFMYSPEEWAVAFHNPGECQGTINLRPMIREGKIMHLCSCCTLSTDQEVL
jgi:hypothetical protein